MTDQEFLNREIAREGLAAKGFVREICELCEEGGRLWRHNGETYSAKKFAALLRLKGVEVIDLRTQEIRCPLCDGVGYQWIKKDLPTQSGLNDSSR